MLPCGAAQRSAAQRSTDRQPAPSRAITHSKSDGLCKGHQRIARPCLAGASAATERDIAQGAGVLIAAQRAQLALAARSLCSRRPPGHQPAAPTATLPRPTHAARGWVRRTCTTASPHRCPLGARARCRTHQQVSGGAVLRAPRSGRRPRPREQRRRAAAQPAARRQRHRARHTHARVPSAESSEAARGRAAGSRGVCAQSSLWRRPQGPTPCSLASREEAELPQPRKRCRRLRCDV